MAHFRDAFRIASRQPFFTLLIVAMLTLGIGGATAMFAAVRGVLLKPLPYEHPEELVWMYGAFRLNDSAAVSPPDFLDYRDAPDGLTDARRHLHFTTGDADSSASDNPRCLWAWRS